MNDQASNASVAPTNVGLSHSGHAILKRLKEQGEFREMADAYRLGVVLALALQVTPSQLKDKVTVFGVSTIDPHGKLRASIEIAYADPTESPYRLMELLADWGVKELERRLGAGSLDLRDVMDATSA